MQKTGWCRLPYEMIADSRLAHTSMIIYAIMLDRSKEGVSKITAEKLSGLTGLSIRTIQRAIVQLKETGYITDVRVENGRTTFYTMKSVIEVKKRPASESEPDSSPESDQNQLEFDMPKSGGTFETDLTLEQIRNLCEMLAPKLADNSAEYVEMSLRGLYADMKMSAKEEVRKEKIVAYLKTMIRNKQPEKYKTYDNSNGFNADEYKMFINNI